MVTLVIDVTPYFQYPSLTPIEGEPTFMAMMQLERANTIAVPSPRGNGQLGHAVIVVVLGAASYNNLVGPNHPWVPPPQPPPTPVIPAGANGPAITNATNQWERSVCE